ncbi:MAG TPA: hypothetical protein VM487_08255 [Phycisphaerae bacterium]|nr:hypothetical protein [Phycisphaerae bacterium]
MARWIKCLKPMALTTPALVPALPAAAAIADTIRVPGGFDRSRAAASAACLQSGGMFE